MFSFSGNLLAGQHDTQKERPPPAKPIPVTFPCLHPPAPSRSTPPALWNEEQTEIAAHFLRVKKPSDVTEDTLALLNVTFQPECDFETLFSSLSNNAQSHLPPKSWLDSSSPAASPPSTSPATSLLSNGRRAPEQRDFIVRARELSFDNEDAFSTLTRKRIGGQAPLRLAHFRKFWEGLDNMAYYWDNSLDEYSSPLPEPVNEGDNVSSDSLPVDTDANSQVTARETQQDRESELKATSPTQEEPRKKAKTEALKDQTSGRFVTANGFGGESMAPHATSRMPNRPLPARVAPPKVPWAENMESYTKSVDLSKGYYRGYRIGNGAEMPDQYRIDCVRAFLEPIAWAFGITLSPHRRPPVLKMDRIRFPVRMSSVAWRGPQDRAKARQGWLDGPVLGMQCRADVNFGASGKLAAESTLDAVREIGGLLLLAQERAREGKAEARGGEGKWWTIKERWGGGPGGEVGEAVGATELQPTKAEEKPAERNRDGSKARRRPSPAELWKILKTANPLWDPKVSYEAIGKDKTSDWDDVFMVSSLNHHISLLRLRIHPAYVQYITEGTLPKDPPSDTDWCSPKLQRTQWFDLFSIDDRTEAMRGLWGVMSYLMRADTSDTTMDTAMPDV